MATLLGTVTYKEIKLVRPILKSLTIEGERMVQDALGALGTKALGRKVAFTDEPFDNFEAAWVKPNKDSFHHGAILYLHGGSYTAGTLAYSKGFGSVITQLTDIPALCVGYRLAPEFPFPCALDDALSAYKRMLEEYSPEDIAVVGESAGGGLVYALLLKIKEESLPMPSCAVAMSPWADLTCSNPSYKTNADVDPSLFEEALKFSANLYSLGDTSNPFVSPVFGDLKGLPPSLIFAGTYELLMDDSILLAGRLNAAGVPCESHIVPGMWHVFPLFNTPESKTAIKQMKKFMYAHIGQKITYEEDR